MMPGSCNLNIYRGDTGRWQFNLWMDVAKTIPADLTGVVVNAAIKDKALNGNFSLAPTCAVTLPNTILMSITPTQSHGLPAVGVWDLQLTYPSTDVFTVLAGAAIVTQDVAP
jgi:hypothetical protein